MQSHRGQYSERSAMLGFCRHLEILTFTFKLMF